MATSQLYILAIYCQATQATCICLELVSYRFSNANYLPHLCCLSSQHIYLALVYTMTWLGNGKWAKPGYPKEASKEAYFNIYYTPPAKEKDALIFT